MNNFAPHLSSSFLGDIGVTLPLLIHTKGILPCSKLLNTHTQTHCDLFVISENISLAWPYLLGPPSLSHTNNSRQNPQPTCGIQPMLTVAASLLRGVLSHSWSQQSMSCEDGPSYQDLIT